MSQNVPKHANNIFQFCCILGKTETKYRIVKAEDLPDDCAYGVDILSPGGRMKGFVGFWKNGNLNRIFIPSRHFQAGSFLKTRIVLDVCASDAVFGSGPVLELYDEASVCYGSSSVIAHIGGFLGKWTDIDDPMKKRQHSIEAVRLYSRIIEEGAGWNKEVKI